METIPLHSSPFFSASLSKWHIKPAWFYITWLVINLFQAAFTQLTSDEGYYWFYSHKLEWGYYDHPPLLALLVKMGYALFPNELGIRFFTVVLNAWGLFLFFKILPGKLQTGMVYLVILSLPLFNYLSFIVFPDGPLLFFISLYLYSYKRFIEKKDWTATLLMALSVALMLYSKYNGLLVVIFTVLIHLNLLRSARFYAAMFIALLLFVPHLWWQYNHGFITFKYHLQVRMSELNTRYIFKYVSQQIIAIGPCLFIIPLIRRTKDRFERTLKFIAAGTFIFFFIISFRTLIHPHWTSVALYPLIYLAVSYFSIKRKSFVYSVFIFFACVVLLARVQLAFPLLPIKHVGLDYYHGREGWASDIKSLAGSNPVFFGDNFRESSLYSFYSGGLGVSLQSGETRSSQYELWNYEDSLQGRDVLFVQLHSFKDSRPVLTKMGKEIHYLMIPGFASYFTIPVDLKFEKKLHTGDSLRVEVTVENNRSAPVVFKDSVNKPFLFFELRNDKEVIQKDSLKGFTQGEMIAAGKALTFTTTIPTNKLAKGKYTLVAGFSQPPLQDSYNSAFYSFVIE